MAPMVIDGSDAMELTTWPGFLPLVISLLMISSILLVIVLCCGRETKHQQQEAREYVCFDFRSEYFCEECALKAWDTFYPNDPNPMLDPAWQDNKQNVIPRRALDYDKRLHYFHHGSGQNYRKRSPYSDAKMKEEYHAIMEQNKSLIGSIRQSPSLRQQQPTNDQRSADRQLPASPFGGTGGRELGGGDGEPMGFVKSARNLQYRTLYDIKSNVFDKGKPRPLAGFVVPGEQQPLAGFVVPSGPAPTLRHDEEQMRAAQANPAYRTIYEAKSGVFDKPRQPQGSMVYPLAGNEARMAAAQANPAYRTLYGVKSGIFDKKPGGAAGGRGGAYPTTSNYRE